jgi:hypothetical protein
MHPVDARQSAGCCGHSSLRGISWCLLGTAPNLRGGPSYRFQAAERVALQIIGSQANFLARSTAGLVSGRKGWD